MYKISVIIPIYNAEKYLKRTIESVINQTFGFNNIELILVDDSSSDSSKEIIKEYSDKYQNIVPLFSKINHGFPGHGRNKGIEIATSKYIMFLDNDDEYSKDYCEVMYNAIESEDVDIVCSNHIIKYQSEEIKRNTLSKVCEEVGVSENPLSLDLNQYHYIYGPEIWTKIFKSSIIKKNNIEFVEDGLNEDTLFLMNYYLFSDTLFFIDYYGYIWYENSYHLSSHSVKSASLFIDSYYREYDFLMQNYDDIDINKEFVSTIENSIGRIVLASNDRKDRLFLIKKLCDFETYINFNGQLNHIWAKITNYFILKMRFNIVLFLMNILKIGATILDFFNKLHN